MHKNALGVPPINKEFLTDFFFDNSNEYRTLRRQIYGDQFLSPAVKKPTQTPQKSTQSPLKQMQNFVQGVFTPSRKGSKADRLSDAPTPPKDMQGAASGKSLKHTGLKTVKQIISRTENLIQAANIGNKSAEVRNELDTLLVVLIDRKEIRSQFRTNLMKRLF